MKNLIFGLLFIPAVSLASGNRVGNGGNVVRCSDSAQVLDLYESGNKSPLNFSTKGYKDIAKEAFQNLEKLNPKQSKQYIARLNAVIEELDFRKDIELVNVKDSHHLLLPKDSKCSVVQAAIRKNLSIDKADRFLINADIWNLLDERNKAALIVHEIVYEHMFKLGESDSVFSRQIVGLLFSERIKEMSREEYQKIYRTAEIPLY